MNYIVLAIIENAQVGKKMAEETGLVWRRSRRGRVDDNRYHFSSGS